MKIKICGMKFPDNIAEVGALQPDYMGFIFYPKSKRFVGDDFPKEAIKNLPRSIKKVGVFVNEMTDIILQKANKYELDVVQLHGNEGVTECQILKNNNLEVIKAFAIEATFDFDILKLYESVCDYFLFDTKTPDYGGSGNVFDWQLLEKYNLRKPFFLSGGLGLPTIEKIKNWNHPMLAGLDFNSQLEDENYKKNIEKVTEVILQIRKK